MSYILTFESLKLPILSGDWVASLRIFINYNYSPFSSSSASLMVLFYLSCFSNTCFIFKSTSVFPELRVSIRFWEWFLVILKWLELGVLYYSVWYLYGYSYCSGPTATYRLNSFAWNYYASYTTLEFWDRHSLSSSSSCSVNFGGDWMPDSCFDWSLYALDIVPRLLISFCWKCWWTFSSCLSHDLRYFL